MAVEAVLGGLVVVGRDREGRIGADLLRVAGQLDGLAGGIRPGAGDDRHPAARRFDAQLHDPHVLLVAEGGRLTGGADRNQPLGSLRDLPFDQPLEGRLIELAVLERRNEGGDGTLETLDCW